MPKMNVTIEYDEPTIRVRTLASTTKAISFCTKWDLSATATSRVLAAAAHYLAQNKNDIVAALNIDHYEIDDEVCLTLVVETDD